MRAAEFTEPTAAGIVLYAEDTGRWGLQQRSDSVNDPGVRAAWGGGREHGESLEQTALRELAEESGYRGPITLEPLARNAKYVTFVGIVPHEFEPRANSEWKDYCWVELGRWPQPLHPGVAAALENVYIKESSLPSSTEKYVFRIDNQHIPDFEQQLKTYYHNKDFSMSGADDWEGSTGKIQGLYAGTRLFTAPYSTGNADKTRYVAKYGPGQPIIYFDRKDIPRLRNNRSWLTVFDGSKFKKLPTGEYFSNNPGKPLKQVEITDPFQWMRDSGWEFKVVDDLPKVLKQLKLEKAKYGAEGMPMQENLAEAFDQPYPLKWSKSEHGDYDALATLADGSKLEIAFAYDTPYEVIVSFWRNNNLEVTGEGDAQRVFATVLTAIQEFVKKERPKKIVFTADKEPGESRASLYTKLVQRYAQAMGFQVETEMVGPALYFTLTRRFGLR